MVLRSWFSRGNLFIALAGSVGMFAQERVSRISLAVDHPLAVASVSGWSWQSAEAFYQDQPGVFWQPVVHAEATFSGEPVPVVACEPHESWLVSANAADTCPAENAAASDTFQFASVGQPPPVIEPRPASIPSVEPKEPAELPPPEVKAPEPQTPGLQEPALQAPELQAPEVDRSDPEVLLPPRPRRRVRGPVDLAESAADPIGMQASASSAHSDKRYATPAELVRQRGIERGQQMQRRLEAQRMLGYHPSRPPVQASPFTTGDQIRPVVIVVPRTVVVQQR